MSVSSDGYWRPDVHTQFLTDDAAVILMHYTGLVQQTERFAAAADADQPTGWTDQYMRLAVRFETGAQQYLWLNTSLFIAKGDYWEPVTSSTRCTACCDRFTNGTQRDADHSRTAVPSTRSTSRRTQSACRTDRPDEPSSPIADTPTSFTGQAIRTTSRLCTADDRYRSHFR